TCSRSAPLSLLLNSSTATRPEAKRLTGAGAGACATGTGAGGGASRLASFCPLQDSGKRSVGTAFQRIVVGVQAGRRSATSRRILISGSPFPLAGPGRRSRASRQPLRG